MKIRDSHAKINGDKTEHDMPSGGVEIIAQDGRTLFCISLEKDGAIHVSASGHCKHNGIVLEDGITVRPKASNVVHVYRLESRLPVVKTSK